MSAAQSVLTLPSLFQANYHPGKVAGDMTDAGDVSVMLLEYLAQRGRSQRYTFDGYATHWLDAIKAGYGSCNFQSVGRDFSGACPPGLQPGYLNGGTRRTLDALQRFPGAQGEQRKALAADVNCLVSATHWAALLSMPYENEDAMVADAVSTTYLSHKNADPVAAAQFLARATYRIARGTPLREALVASAAVQRDAFIDARLREALAKVEEAADPSSALASQGRFVDDTAGGEGVAHGGRSSGVHLLCAAL
jgi:ADP-ribosylglycohydrolase